MISSLIDGALDFAVAPGYTKVGFLARRALGWENLEPGCMAGRRVLVTGASSGIGLAAARGLFDLGASVDLLVRSRERGESAAGEISRSGLGECAVHLADLSSLESIRAFTAGYRGADGRLDVLVNNAGALPTTRQTSVDGHELTFATNVLGPFVLTNELLPLLLAAAPSRSVNVSSGGRYTATLDPGDLESERREYSGPDVYARTKRAEVVLTEMWAQRLRGTGIVVHSMHPGWVDTPGVKSSLPRFHAVTGPLLRSPEEGADTIIWLAAAQEPARSSAGFWHDRRMRTTHRLPRTGESAAERSELWEACLRLGGPNSRASEAILAGRA